MLPNIKTGLENDIISKALNLINLPEISEYALINSACMEYNQTTKKVYSFYFSDGFLPHFVEKYISEFIDGKRVIILDENKSDGLLLA